MSDQNRERGRDEEIQKRIRELRDEIDSLQSTEQARQILGVINRMLSIISSENGTHGRMLDRMDKLTEIQAQMTESQVKMNKLMFGNGDAEEETFVDLMKQQKRLTGLIRKALATIIVALIMFAGKSWYEGVKTNAVLAGQKDAATKAANKP